MVKQKIFRYALFSVLVIAVQLTAANYYYGGIHQSQLWWDVGVKSLFLLGCIYIGRWLCLRWYLGNKPLSFILYSVVTCIALTIFWWLLLRNVMGKPHTSIVELFVNDMPLYFMGMVAGMLIKLVRATIRRQVQEALLAAAQKQGELNLLRAQLSPHFLFNTLNNLYGISVAEPQLIPGLLLKLSDLLRYTVYETGRSFVPLEDELTYIRNYLAFEQIRVSDRMNLQVRLVNPLDPGVLIAPMVLVIFIENAFKHAKDSFDNRISFDISLFVAEGFIHFEIRNSLCQKAEKKNIPDVRGLGLENTLKRLELLYGNSYSLEQSSDSQWYLVHLRLAVK